MKIHIENTARTEHWHNMSVQHQQDYYKYLEKAEAETDPEMRELWSFMAFFAREDCASAYVMARIQAVGGSQYLRQ